MTELRKLSVTEVEKILLLHEVWLSTYGKSGQHANLMNTNLSGFNLKHAVLRDSNLVGADLTEADLTGADLTGADLTAANLLNANLQYALLTNTTLDKANLQNADLRHAYIKNIDISKVKVNGVKSTGQINFSKHNDHDFFFDSNKLDDLKSQLRIKDHKIEELEIELQNATDETEQESLRNELTRASFDKIELITKVDLLKKEVEKQKQQIEIGNRIDKAISALQSSLKNTDEKISSLKNQSNAFSFIGFILMILIVLSVCIFIYTWINHPQSLFITDFIKLMQGTKGVAFLLITFPTLIVFLIAIGMLKHSNKLSAEFLHYAKMKHQIELYSGLLEAAQHTAASIKDPEKAETYVEETFTKIRDKLLDSQAPETAAPAADKDEAVSIKDLAELIKSVKS